MQGLRQFTQTLVRRLLCVLFIRQSALPTCSAGTERDLDALWIEGLNDATNQARYDTAWQYRLDPAVYPEWGISREWHVDIELGGRWNEGYTMVHQATIGSGFLKVAWVQDLNGPDEIRFILSTRFHF